MNEALIWLLQSINLSDVAELIQIAVLIFMLKAITKISGLTADVWEWHNQPDPKHPGAMRWWGLDISDLKQALESQRAQESRAHLEILKALESLKSEIHVERNHG